MIIIVFSPIFQLCDGESKLHFHEMMMMIRGPLCTRTCLVFFFRASSLKQKHYPDFKPPNLRCCSIMLHGKAANADFIVLGLTRLKLEHTTTLKASMLIIKSPMRFGLLDIKLMSPLIKVYIYDRLISAFGFKLASTPQIGIH